MKGQPMKYWLIKSEPEVYSIDHMQKEQVTVWEGVRNYQARNFMQKEMKTGDLVLFYHSNAEPSGVAGIVEVCGEAEPDKTAWDKKSEYFDPRSTPQKPVWFGAKLKFKRKFKNLIDLPSIRAQKTLAKMTLVQRGSRLSVQPVTEKEFEMILKMAREKI